MGSACVIGVDLGGTKLLAGVVDDALRVRHRVRREPGAGDQGALLAAVEEVVREAWAATADEVSAVGFGIPAVLTGERVAFSTHRPLEGLAFAAVMSGRLGLPVVVDNDASLSLLGEHRAGAARGVRDALMLTLGTGIGGGVLLGGRLLPVAGELGHVVVELDGPRCQGKCPNRGCLEALASGSALGREGERLARERRGSALAAAGHLTGARVTELALGGDAAAREAVALVGRRLGAGLSGLVNVFAPEVVVIGGGVVAAGELLLAPARAELAARALPPLAAAARVEAAALGEEAGMIGAAVAAQDALAARAPGGLA